MKRTLAAAAIVLAAAALLTLGTAVSWAPSADAWIICEDCSGFPNSAACGGTCNGVITRTCGEYRAAGCSGWQLRAPASPAESKAHFLQSLQDAEPAITTDEPQQEPVTTQPSPLQQDPAVSEN
ncbi:MAG: hypothetical protein AAGD01_13880 [Acidobacteriota bacterium]